MEQEFFNERNCFQHDAKNEDLENLVCDRLSLIISFIQSNKDICLASVLFTSFVCALKDRSCTK